MISQDWVGPFASHQGMISQSRFPKTQTSLSRELCGPSGRDMGWAWARHPALIRLAILSDPTLATANSQSRLG